MEEFEARLYLGSAAEPVAATVSLNQSLVKIDYDEKTEEYPVNDIQVEEGGHLGDRVRVKFTGADRLLVLSGHQFLDYLESKHPELESVKKSKAVKNKVKHSNIIRGSHVLICLGVLFGIGLAAYFSLDIFVDMAASNVPVEAEELIGSMVVPESRLSQVLKNTKTGNEERFKKLARIKTIGNKLVKAIGETPYTFRFDILENKEVNAFAAPGGYIYVLDGLIKEAKSDDEIAGVLAHEIGHVVHRDCLKRLLHTSGLSICIAIATGGTVSNEQAKVLIPTLQQLESLSYSRGQEANADQIGVELSLKAGYEPEALAGFFQRLEKEQENMPKAAMLFLSDHPMGVDRVKAIKKEAEIQRKKLGINKG